MQWNQREGSGLEVRGWHSRGYLPHFDPGEVSQAITLHLADSLPQKVLDKWKTQLADLPDEEAKRKLRNRIEAYLDQGYGSCCLKDPRVAQLMQNSWFCFDGERYRLHAWVVMPNHVHFLLRPINEHSLAQIMHSFKSYTALEANRILGRTGTFWQVEYYDREIRDAEHFGNARRYIENNPVKARLCAKPADWFFGSAYHRLHPSNQETPNSK